MNIKFLNHLRKKVVIKKLYQMFVVDNELIKKDIEETFRARKCKANEKDIKGKFKHLMYYYPEFAFVFFHRTKRIKPSTRKLFLKQDYLCKIFGSTKIGGGLNCYHPYATVINAKSIGENFQFRNGLTIGNKGNDNSLIPRIGTDVTVGANVVIIGDIIVGDNVIIGAGSVVVKDVPSNSVVAGNPARVIKKLFEE